MARARTVTALIMSAFAPELAPLGLAARTRGQGRLASRIACVPVGIGAIDAAAGAAAAIARFQPVVALFVGTAGSYRSSPPIGGAVVARRICLASGEVLRGQAYLPGPMRTRVATYSLLRRQLLRAVPAQSADVATTIGITSGRALGKRIADATGSTVENLEVFAVARAWSLGFGAGGPRARAARALLCTAGVIAAAFLAVERTNASYLEGLGL